jgi:hypothetical protein
MCDRVGYGNHLNSPGKLVSTARLSDRRRLSAAARQSIEPARSAASLREVALQNHLAQNQLSQTHLSQTHLSQTHLSQTHLSQTHLSK